MIIFSMCQVRGITIFWPVSFVRYIRRDDSALLFEHRQLLMSMMNNNTVKSTPEMAPNMRCEVYTWATIICLSDFFRSTRRVSSLSQPKFILQNEPLSLFFWDVDKKAEITAVNALFLVFESVVHLWKHCGIVISGPMSNTPNWNWGNAKSYTQKNYLFE